MSLNKRLIETGGDTLPPGPSSDAFTVKLYVGTRTAQSITGVGFKSDLIWIKQRGGTNPHGLWDSTRGAGPYLTPPSTDAQTGNSGDLMGSFDTDGFQVNSNYLQYTAHDNTNKNGANSDYVAWCWRANEGTTSSNTDGSVTSTIQVMADAGFSIIKYVGDNGGIGGTGTVGHGLGYTPRFIIGKSSSATNSWIVYLNDGTDYWHGYLGGTSALTKNASNTQVGTPNETTIGLSHVGTNQSGVDYMYYAWTPRSGYSSFGSYSGGSTGSSNEITIGFQPDWILIRRTDVGDDWTIIDSVRGDGASSKRLIANTNEAEKSATSIWFPTSTGFYFSGTGDSYNKSGGTYIYAAFKIVS